MPYIIADTPYHMTYFDGDDNCVYMRLKEKPMVEENTKEDQIYNLIRKTPCDQCDNLCICGKTDEYRKFINDVVAAIGDMPEFLDMTISCKHYRYIF